MVTMLRETPREYTVFNNGLYIGTVAWDRIQKWVASDYRDQTIGDGYQNPRHACDTLADIFHD